MIVRSWNGKSIEDCDREELLSLIERISQREARNLQRLHRLYEALWEIREIVDSVGNAPYPTYTKGESCNLDPINFRVTEFETTGSPGDEEDEDDGA